MAEVLAVAAIKGGTGKTTTAISVAQAAAADGKRVLTIDLDPQCSLSIWQRADLKKPGSYEVIARGAALPGAMQGEGIKVICGNANLTALKTSPGSARRLEQAIIPCLPDFDLIVIDTAPAMNEALNCGLFAADGLLIPVEADSASLQGFYQIVDIAHMIQREKPSLRIIGTVVTKFDARPKINRLLREAIEGQARAQGIPYLGEIRQGVAMREAMAMQANVYDTKSNPAEDYKRLYREILKQEG